MRSSSLIVRGLSVLGLVVVAIAQVGCSGPSIGGSPMFKTSASGESDNSLLGISANPVEWVKDKDREASVAAAKADSSDPVAKAIVIEDSDMYWGPKYGGTWFSAGDYNKRQKLVDKRSTTKVADRAPLNTEIKKLSDQIVANEKTKFTAKLAELEAAKTKNPDDAQEINSQAVWVQARLADLDRVPAQYGSETFNITALAKSSEGSATSSMASRQ